MRSAKTQKRSRPSAILHISQGAHEIAGKRISQYTASRKKRELEIIEFWRTDAGDSIRRPGLIYKEFDGKNVITKNVPERR